ncbi:MAG: hypothetical protein H0W75_12350 [Chitinophagaceae bacterium]|nr:hypothetical protein [Chitinophagaceae bacterium]
MSQCGKQEKIPVDVQTFAVAEEMDLNPTVIALNGGEDYELLFTIRQADFEKLKGLEGISFIGHITEAEAGLALVDKGDHEISLKSQGWSSLQ